MNKNSVMHVFFLAFLLGTATGWADTGDDSAVERGRYLVIISGCNDCHTEGYVAAAGEMPEDQWLVGDTFGWRGPWGTTYGPNLRIVAEALTEDQWVALAKTLTARPPMPYFNLNIMKAEDTRAIYQFIRQLGPVGDPAPAFVPPDEEPDPPYATFPAPPPE